MEHFRETEARFMGLREKLEYGVYHVIAPLTIEAFITKDPVPFADRGKGEGRILLPGDH